MKRLHSGLFISLIISSLCSISYGDDAHLRARIKTAGDITKYPEANLVVIFDSTKVKVIDNGLSYVTMHRLIKVLKQAGSLELSCQRFDYDPLSAYVEVKSVRIFRNGGGIDIVPLNTIIDVTAPARAIYWGARQKMVPVGRLEVGDALELIVFRKGFTYALLGFDGAADSSPVDFQVQSDDERYIPPMRGHFYDIVPFWASVPTLLKTYTVTLPANKTLQYEFYNGEATSWIHFQREFTEYHWEKKDIGIFKTETNMVAATDVAPELLVSTSPDWYAKSLWFYKVNEDFGSFDVTPEIKTMVEGLVKNCKDDEEKVSVLTHWVAEEIRYSGLTMGTGEGYTLHKGAMTFCDRCGVCKDKAGMLITMLRAAGFQSYPAMTMAGSRIDRIPADQFNHSVTVWKKKDGTYVLLDPTWVPGVRELWSSAEQQQEYLMGVPEGADLQTTPISPAEKHYFNISGESELTADGDLTGSFTLEAEGQSDATIRRGFTRSQKPLWRAYIERAMYEISPLAEIIQLTFDDPYDLSKPVQIKVQYRIPQYASRLNGRLIFTPLIARHPFADPATSGHLSMNFDLQERIYPFVTRCSRLVNFKEKIRLPSNYKIAFKPEFDQKNGEAADFNVKYEVEGNKLIFEQTLRLKKRIYSAEEWPNFKAAVTAAKKVMHEPIVLVLK